MSEQLEHEDYLWTATGPTDAEIAALERELLTLRWQPRITAVAEAVAPSGAGSTAPRSGLAVVAAEPTPRRRRAPAEASASGPGWWPAAAAGLFALAAVLTLVVWAGGPGGPGEAPSSPDRSLAPGGPVSPDLKDPFARDRQDQDEAGSAGEFPRPGRPVSPDLKDPFGTEAPSDAEPERRPSSTRPKGRVSPDLKDPFGPRDADDEDDEVDEDDNARAASKNGPDVLDPFDDAPADASSAPRDPGTLTDPFTGEPKPASKHSPDLKDPFARD